MEKLAKLMQSIKIILNFESANGNRSFNHLKIFKKFYQTKEEYRWRVYPTYYAFQNIALHQSLYTIKAELHLF